MLDIWIVKTPGGDVTSLKNAALIGFIIINLIALTTTVVAADNDHQNVDGGGEPQFIQGPVTIIEGGGEPQIYSNDLWVIEGGGEPQVNIDGGGEPQIFAGPVTIIDGGGEPQIYTETTYVYFIDGGGEPQAS